MAENNTIGLAMQLDVTDLKAGLKEVNKAIKTSRDEFNNATAGLEKWTKSSEGLNAKVKQLNKQLEAQEKAVAGYKAEIERVQSLEGDHSEQLSELKEKLSEYESKVKSTQTQITKYSKTLEKVTSDEKKESLSVNKLSKSIEEQKAKLKELNDEYASAKLDKNKTQAKNLKSEIDKLTKEIEKNEKQMNKATKESKSFGDNLKDLESIGKSANKGLAIIGGTIAGIVGAFFATATATKELRTNMEKLTVGFESSGLSAEQAKETYKELYSVVGDEGKATEATAFLGKLAKTQEELTVWTDTLTGIYAQFGDSLPIENLAEASNETAKTGKITGGLADALNWANTEGRNFGVALKEQIKFTELNEKQLTYLTEAERKEYDSKKAQYEAIEEWNKKVNEATSAEDKFQLALDNCTTEQERNKLITETLNSLYGESAEAFKESNKEVIESNKAQAKLSEKMAEVGAMAEPIINDIKEIGLQLAVALIPVIEKILPIIMDNLPMIATILGTVAGAIITFTTAVKIATAAQALMNVVMAANPIGLIIVGITALIAIIGALVVVIVSNWDKIKAKTLEIWGAIKGFVVGVWDAIKNAWSAVGTWFSNIFTKAWNGIKSAWNGVTKFFTDIRENIIKAFSDLPEKMLDVGINLVKGLWNGVKDMTKWITGKLKEFAGDVLGGIKKFFGIHSPSKETAKIGKFMAEGMSVGLESGKKDVEKSGEKIGQAFIDGSVKQIEHGGVDLEKATERAIRLAASNVKSWKDYFAEITKVDKDSFKNGSEAGEKFISGLENELNVKKNISEMLGSQFDMSEVLSDQNKKIEKVLTELFSIDPKTINDTFKSTDKSVQAMVEKYKANVEEIKRISQSGVAIDVKVEETWIDKFKRQLDEAGKKLKEWQDGAGRVFASIGKTFGNIGSSVMSYMTAISDYQNQVSNNRIRKIDEELEKVEESREAELEAVQNTANSELKELDKMYAQELITDDEYRAKKKEIENQLFLDQEAINAQKLADEEKLRNEKEELQRKQFEAQKRNSYAQTIINGAQAIIKGFADLGPIAGAINAGIQSGLTAIQLATINAQEFVPALAKGGIVNGATLALIGEAGKEAVMPLENNTGWITELAEKLNAVMQKDFSIGLDTDSQGVYARGSIINNYYYQTINSPKALTRREIYRDSKNLLALKG